MKLQNKLDEEGEKFITGFEGFSDRPYYATAEEKKEGIATIGFGFTFYPNGKKVKITDKQITREEAFVMFRLIAQKFCDIVNSKIKVNINQHQFNALVSHTYNTGGSNTLFNLVNNEANKESIVKWFVERYITQNNKVIPGLARRRKEEANLYFKK